MISEEFTPKNRKHWRKWLELNYSRTNGLWLIFYKKTSKYYNLSYEEARDEALCFGWIDSTKCKIDENKFKQYFSPRRKNSGWSSFNKKKIKELIDCGLMAKPGFDAIEQAKKNGNYYIFDDIENLKLPKELEEEFKNNKKAKIIYDKLSFREKKHILYRIYLLKTEKGKRERSKKIVENFLCMKSIIEI